MKNLLLIGVITLLSGCFGEGVNPANKDGLDNGSDTTPKLSFTSSANQVDQGDTVLLAWLGEAVENCQADGAWAGVKTISGSESIQLSDLGSQQFSLSCDVVDSTDTLTKHVTVLVVEGSSGVTPSLTLTSSANQVEQGQATQLTWSGESIENCQAGGAWSGAKATEGTESVQLTTLGNQQMSLSCGVVDSTDTITKEVTVLVVVVTGGETPELTLTSTPSEIEQGQSTLISWASKAVENCQAGGAWSGAKGASGTEEVMLSDVGSQEFSLVCDIVNSSDTLTKATTVLVVAAGGNDDPKSGVDGDDADALYEHFNQYAE